MVVRKTVHMAQELNIPIFGIVENMSFYPCPDTGNQHFIFGPSHALEVAKLADAPVLARLPIIPEFAQLADSGDIEKFEDAAHTAMASAFLLIVPPAKDEPQEEMEQDQDQEAADALDENDTVPVEAGAAPVEEFAPPVGEE
jgi:hypothetical protein